MVWCCKVLVIWLIGCPHLSLVKKISFSCSPSQKCLLHDSSGIWLYLFCPTCLLSKTNCLLDLSNVSLLDILELKKDIDVTIPLPKSISCLPTSHFSSLFYISLYLFLVLHLCLFLFHYLSLPAHVSADSSPAPPGDTSEPHASTPV